MRLLVLAGLLFGPAAGRAAAQDPFFLTDQEFRAGMLEQEAQLAEQEFRRSRELGWLRSYVFRARELALAAGGAAPSARLMTARRAYAASAQEAARRLPAPERATRETAEWMRGLHLIALRRAALSTHRPEEFESLVSELEATLLRLASSDDDALLESSLERRRAEALEAFQAFSARLTAFRH